MPVYSRHPDYEANAPEWRRCRDSIGGEVPVKSRGNPSGSEYLPKLPGHTPAEYEAYLKRALFYNATSRSRDGLAGLIKRKSPSIEIPEALKTLTESLTLRGLDLTSFADLVVDETIAVGRAGCLVDYTRRTQRARSRAEEDGRPYVTFYSAEKIINWKVEAVSGVPRLRMLVLTESYEKPGSDEFKADLGVQYRVLDFEDGQRYRQRVFREEEEVLELRSYPYMGPSSVDEIPFVFFGPKAGGAEVERPPLADLAAVNLSHYRTMADLENGRHWVGSPTPYFIGSFESQDGSEVTEVKLGSSSGIHMSEGSEVGFLEFEGSGLETLENAAKQKEEYMAVLGARLLAQDKRMVEAAETAAIHRAGEAATLASIARSVSRSLTRVLELVAEWAYIKGEISVELNTDFMATEMSPQMVMALLQSLQAGRIGSSDFVHALKQGEILREDRTAEDIADEVAMTPPSMAGGGFGFADDE